MDLGRGQGLLGVHVTLTGVNEAGIAASTQEWAVGTTSVAAQGVGDTD